MSPKGSKLIKMYTQMAEKGYDCADGTFVPSDYVYTSFELRKFAKHLKSLLQESKSILDYGCGGSNWYSGDFLPESNHCAVSYFDLEAAYMYEPARDIDERQKVDTVICFDVLEHLFIQDLPSTLEEIFSYARKSVILNIAGYAANALLPNGENAHTILMPLLWWKGVLDVVSLKFPSVEVHVLYSINSGQAQSLTPWKASGWIESETFGVKV